MFPISYFERSVTPWRAMPLILLYVLLFPVRASAAAWVAVGENGTIINSADGLTWSSATSASSETLRGVYFDGVGTWAAAGQQGTVVNSPDAAVWTPQTSGNTNPLWGTVFAGGQWIVSGGSGRVITSPDSVVWASVNGSFSFTLYDIAYDGSGLYVIAGDSGFFPIILTSNDAVTWTQKPPQPSNAEGFYGVSYGANEWVAVGDVGTIRTSADPESRAWAIQTSGTSANLRDIVYNGTDLYVVVGVGGVILTSADARTWTPSNSGLGTDIDLVGVEYDGAGLYVAVGTDGTILSSNDGISWTPQISPIIQNLRDVAVGKFPQRITFDSQLNQVIIPAGTFPLDPPAVASSGLPVAYASLTNGVCTISSNVVTMVTVGLCTIEASQPGDSAYLPAISVTQDIVIEKAAQTINFPTQNPFFRNFVLNGVYALDPAATASSTLAVSYTGLTPSICAFNASTLNVTMIAAGQCEIQASQPGDDNFLPAASVSQVVLQIVEPPFGQRTNPGLVFTPQASEIFAPGGTFPLTPAAITTQTVSDPQPQIIYSSSTPAICTIPLRGSIAVTMIDVGACKIVSASLPTSLYEVGGPISAIIQILPRPQTINFGVQSDQVFLFGGSFVLAPAAVATSGLAVNYVSLDSSICSINGVTVTMNAPGNCIIQATQAGDNTWESAAAVNQTVTLATAGQASSIPVLSSPLLALLSLLVAGAGIIVFRGKNT